MATSRGYFLGQIVDDLDSISSQIANRARLNLLDLNVLVESFFGQVLGVLFDASFANLNVDGVNSPGLDLVCEKEKIGVQITSRNDLAKIRDTLGKITPDQKGKYERFIVLVIGKRQQTYGLKDEDLAGLRFNPDKDIWDTNTICRNVTELKIDQLQNLYQIVQREVARVKVELEIPDADGNYLTSLKDYAEKTAIVRSDGQTFFDATIDPQTKKPSYASVADAARDLDGLVDELAKLPRISRELLTYIWRYRDEAASQIRVNADVLTRKLRYPNLDDELRLLADRAFVVEEISEERARSDYWFLTFPKRFTPKHPNFYECFFEFLENQNVDVDRVFVALNLDAFGAPK